MENISKFAPENDEEWLELYRAIGLSDVPCRIRFMVNEENRLENQKRKVEDSKDKNAKTEKNEYYRKQYYEKNGWVYKPKN
jgi:hypothetical protein